MEIVVLRLGHRLSRDKRVSTHVALVARAFGAKEIIFANIYEKEIEERVKRVCEIFGGKFQVNSTEKPRELVLEWRKKGGVVVHLTMYGMPLLEKVNELREEKKIMVVVGAEKVPGWVYEVSDYNISVTNQPHSEIAALAVFLDRLFDGREIYFKYPNAKVKILPSEKGKKVIAI